MQTYVKRCDTPYSRKLEQRCEVRVRIELTDPSGADRDDRRAVRGDLVRIHPHRRARHLADHRGQADAALPTIEVEPAVVEDLGSETHVIFPIDVPPVDVEAVRAATDEKERAVLLAVDRRALFTAEVAETTEARVGSKLRLALDPSRFHFFEPETGKTLRSSAVGVTS